MFPIQFEPIKEKGERNWIISFLKSIWVKFFVDNPLNGIIAAATVVIALAAISNLSLNKKITELLINQHELLNRAYIGVAEKGRMPKGENYLFYFEIKNVGNVPGKETIAKVKVNNEVPAELNMGYFFPNQTRTLKVYEIDNATKYDRLIKMKATVVIEIEYCRDNLGNKGICHQKFYYNPKHGKLNVVSSDYE